MDWPNEITLEFLKLYEQEQVIWNPKNSQHKNRISVHKAWRRIQNSLSIQCSMADLKKKKESLMASFRFLLNKVKASKKSGVDVEVVFKPSWFAYATMERFLRNIYQPRSIAKEEVHYFPNLVTEALNLEQEFQDPSTNETEQNDILETVKTEIIEDENDNETFSESVTVENNFNLHLDKDNRKRKNSMTGIESPLDNAYTMKTVYGKSDEEECVLYANLLATKLRKFDENTRDILMHEIDSLIFKTKMQQRNFNYQPLITNSTLE